MYNEPPSRLAAFYRALLTLYPRGFRDHFGASMEQTFNDLCRDCRETGSTGLFALVLRQSVDTLASAGNEHIRLLTEGENMKTFGIDVAFAAGIGFLLVLPLIFLEAVNGANTPGKFPFPLFGFMWLLATIFFALLIPIIRALRKGTNVLASPATFLLRVIFLTIIAVIWSWGMVDQMPCFLGVPNCD